MTYIQVGDVRAFIDKSLSGDTGHNPNTAASWRTILTKWVAFAKKVGLSETEIIEETVIQHESEFRNFIFSLGTTEKTALQYYKGLLRLLDLFQRDKNLPHTDNQETASIAATNKDRVAIILDYPILLSDSGSAKLSIPGNLSEQDRSDLCRALRAYADFFTNRP